MRFCDWIAVSFSIVTIISFSLIMHLFVPIVYNWIKDIKNSKKIQN